MVCSLVAACGLPRRWCDPALLSRKRRCTSDLLEQRLPAFPGGVARLAVGTGVSGVLAGAHEAVAGAFVSDRLEGLVQLLHQRRRLGHGRVDARVVAAVEAVNWA